MSPAQTMRNSSARCSASRTHTPTTASPPMDSVEGKRGMAEMTRFRNRLNRSYELGRISSDDYEELHALTNQMIRKLNEMRSSK